MVQFINGNQALLYDSSLKQNVLVEIKDGAPFCTNCNLNDCAHAGDLQYVYSNSIIAMGKEIVVKHSLSHIDSRRYQEIAKLFFLS